MAYEAPAIIELGSIAEFTQGSVNNSAGDGMSRRGPANANPMTS